MLTNILIDMIIDENLNLLKLLKDDSTQHNILKLSTFGNMSTGPIQLTTGR